jgi:transposase
MELHCETPRCRCEKYGVKTVKVPWAEPGSRFTLHFEAFAVAVIGACRSLSPATGLLGRHWSSLQRIIDAAVKRRLTRRTTEGITRVDLDEKSFLRGQSCVSLMTELDGRRVLEVVPNRSIDAGVKL